MEPPIPSGKVLHNYGTSPFIIGKFTISTGPFSIAMLNCQSSVSYDIWVCLVMISTARGQPPEPWQLEQLVHLPHCKVCSKAAGVRG